MLYVVSNMKNILLSLTDATQLGEHDSFAPNKLHLLLNAHIFKLKTIFPQCYIK